MAKEDKAAQTAQADKATTRLYVRSVSPKGFRRIGRYFGPEEEGIDATPEQAAILFEADRAGDLRVLTQEMKDIAEVVTRKAAQRPAPKADPKVEG